MSQFRTEYVVVTGGEPMVAKGIHQLTDQLKEIGKHITIETAATSLSGRYRVRSRITKSKAEQLDS